MRPILEKIALGPDRSFNFFDYRADRGFKCPFHYHPEVELTLIAKGRGQRFVGDHIARFAAGDLVLIGPNLPHSYVSDEGSGGHAFVLQFLPDCLGPGFFELAEMRALGRLLSRCRVGLSFQGAARDRAVAALLTLREKRGPARVTGFLELLQSLAAARHRALASPNYAPSLGLYQGERINRVCELISRSFRDDITQREAAGLVKMSGPSFSRFFRRATNRTFRSFLNEVRVGHASRLLAESERSIAEIGYDSGFGNLSNFNRQFLKLRRKTPGAFRRDLDAAC